MQSQQWQQWVQICFLCLSECEDCCQQTVLVNPGQRFFVSHSFVLPSPKIPNGKVASQSQWWGVTLEHDQWIYKRFHLVYTKPFCFHEVYVFCYSLLTQQKGSWNLQDLLPESAQASHKKIQKFPFIQNKTQKKRRRRKRKKSKGLRNENQRQRKTEKQTKNRQLI